MNIDGRTTSEQLYIPTLLVVGACEALRVRCYHAAKATGLAIKACEMSEAAVAIPRRHPIAIVVPIPAAGEPAEDLSALARDVRAALLPVDPEVSVRELEAMIAAAIDGGLAQRERRGGAGRYSIVDGIEEEAPFSRRSVPPPSSAPPRSLSSPGIVSVRAPAPAPTLPPAPVSTLPQGPPGLASTRPPATSDARQGPRRESVPAEPPASGAQRASSVPAPASDEQRPSGGPFAALRAVLSWR